MTADRPTQTGATSAPVAAGVAFVAFVIVIGLNLRPFVTSVGPLAQQISEATGMSMTALSVMTFLPMFLMGVLGFAAPRLQRTLGARGVVMGGMLLLAMGLALRGVAREQALLLASALICGLGVAAVQAIFPGILKARFPHRVPAMTGLYSAALMGGGALGAYLAPRVATMAGSWQLSLAFFAPLALVGALLAAMMIRKSSPQKRAENGPIPSYWRAPRAFLLMACFGLVNSGYSLAVAWLAPFYQSIGHSAAAGGAIVAVMALAQMVTALCLPFLGRKSRDKRPWLWLTLALQLLGFGGLILAPELSPYLIATVLGSGLGGCFALTLVISLDHLADPWRAGALSAAMQGGGFIIAALVPLMISAFHGLVPDYSLIWALQSALVVIVALLALRLDPARYTQALARRG